MHYRSEIDGLRALAIIPVILFHAGTEFCSGGFLGVDIFFVISGYLITSILIGELEQGNFSILRFYERRARRILPALFVVMLACLPFAYMWMLPSQLEDFAQSLVAVSLFLSNWLFWSEASYFASATELKPLLHTWSLAVEEQYYLMFPLLLLLCWRIFRPFTFGFIFLLAAMSFLLAEWGWRNEPEINFYFTFSRFWELLVGSMCAFLTVGQKQRSSNFLGAIGIALIISAIFYYDENTPFPSAYALVPVVGTALIILFADKTTWTARLLSTRGFVGVGLISYSAYLWHQPLFAFARIRSLTEPSHYLMALLAAAALLLAWVTWRWVEQPFRNRANPILVTRRSVFAASGAVGAIFVAIGFSVDQGEGLKGRWSDVGIAKFFENYEAKHMRKECFLTSGRNEFSMYDQATCLPVSDSIKNVLIVGDSHGAHLAQAMIDEYPDLNILQATSSG
ncbi:MAG: acyltransferase family protein, partial [Flavobacteriaceae bacterium]|nr:acyltransferase family protein [Flavobacteriaceae bacterium]